ncbi:copper homeostasis protein CutC [Rhodanobacter sp. PCA2]|uniref:copper homeostasis protein CutC n=1 Tax=Rhodanobacter sp. PCA2 TaxID=2006117 RepID=UPI0015E691F4|nr:copper homeostasis protein CutC [Rhodanobacter sp. PCA2]MBA2078803.1 copper homeostasis protein CutC [Rhodanobacter sp. PCA2]
MSGCLLEVAANSVASVLAAQVGGAGRVELCAALELGGLTPSQATIAMARERLRIPLYVLIRPRAGDFLYDELECEAMRRDIETCAALGCDGVVLGMLDAEGDVDLPRCRALIDAAGSMGVTFHRAFDLARDPRRALEDAIALGCERVLTSGGQASALEGAPLIRELLAQAAGRIAIMPGAGVTPGNLAALAVATGAREFHASAKRQLDSGMRHRPPLLTDMQGGELRSDEEQVRVLVQALRSSG